MEHFKHLTYASFELDGPYGSKHNEDLEDIYQMFKARLISELMVVTYPSKDIGVITDRPLNNEVKK